MRQRVVKIDTNLLETFVMVADAGGLSAAGSMLGVPQSIVSRRIKELEASCGARLLYRHGRGVRLTPAGDTLYQAAQPLIAQFAAVLNSVSEQNSTPSGTVGVAVSPSFMSAVGLPILEEMETLFPQIRLNLVSGYSRHIHEWLLQARVDIGILSDLGLSSQLIAEDLGTGRIVLVARPDFEFPPPAKAGELNFEEIAALPLAIATKGQGLRKYIDVAAAKSGITLNVSYEVDDIYLTKDLVLTGRVAALLPRLAIIRELANGTLVERQFGSPQVHARFILATARNRPLTAAMNATITGIKSVTARTLVALG